MSDDWDLFATPEQGVVKTHGVSQCRGTFCCVHNPSDHLMVGWPMIFEAKKLYLALRLCEHGEGHPDPDSLRYFAGLDNLRDGVLAWFALHRCDGCCI